MNALKSLCALALLVLAPQVHADFYTGVNYFGGNPTHWQDMQCTGGYSSASDYSIYYMWDFQRRVC